MIPTVVASLPESELRPLPVEPPPKPLPLEQQPRVLPHLQLDPAKARAWGEEWRNKHASRWSSGEDRGLFLKHRLRSSAPVSKSHCRDTILALERQINGGLQLSAEGK